MLLGTLVASLLGNMLAGKGVIWAVYGEELNRIFSLPHRVNNFEIKKYYQKKLKFKGVSSWNNLPKTVKDGAHIANLNWCKSLGMH